MPHGDQVYLIFVSTAGGVNAGGTGVKVTGVRFLPNNNNLVICACHSSSGGGLRSGGGGEGLLRVLNVSTGKWSQGAGGHTTGKVNCMETVGSGALVSSTQQPSSHLGVR